MKTTIIEGPRQSGKTTMLREFVRQYIETTDKSIMIASPAFNMSQNIIIGLPKSNRQYLRSLGPTGSHTSTLFGVDALIIDEFTHCDNKRLQYILCSALYGNKDLIITVEQGTMEKLSDEVAFLLNDCIMASEQQFTKI